MDEQEYQKRKQDILSPIFVNKEQALELRERNLYHRERELEKTKITNKELRILTENPDVQIGDMMREFESKHHPSKEIKEYLAKLWVYFSEESIKRFTSQYELYLQKEDKNTKKIKFYQDKINLLKSTETTNSEVKE